MNHFPCQTSWVNIQGPRNWPEFWRDELEMHLKMCNSCMKLYKLYLHINSHILILYLSPCSSIFHVNSCRKNTPTRWVARTSLDQGIRDVPARKVDGQVKKAAQLQIHDHRWKHSWDRHVKPCTKLQVNPRWKLFALGYSQIMQQNRATEIYSRPFLWFFCPLWKKRAVRQDELTDVRERGEKPWDLVNWQNIAKRTLRIQHVDPELGGKIEVLKAFSACTIP